MFEFLLKYSPVIYREGHFAIKHLPSLFVCIAGLALLLLVLWLVYLKTTLQIGTRFKNSLIVLKFGVIALLFFVLFEPVINVSTVVPRKSSLLLLIDESKSMSIPDASDKKARIDFVKNLLGDSEQPGLLTELEKNFKVQTHVFSSQVAHLQTPQALTARGTATDLGECLAFAAETSSQGAIAGVVIFTDGADNGETDPLEKANLLQARNIPVYTVGIGNENLEDLEIAKVATNHSVIENSVVEVSALIKSSPPGSRDVELELREEGAIVKQQTEKISGSASRVTMKFSPQKKGFVRYTLKVVSRARETIAENNSKSFLIDNRSKQARVLYIDGHPRNEFRFIRRAMDGDENIKLVSLLRTGFPDKFYRQGIENQDELKDGYPKTREELFKYDAIIFGQIEAKFLTPAQLENTLEFVSRRGGGFLMLGGLSTFSHGGYEGTAIEKLLPVELPMQNGHATPTPATLGDKFKLVLTPEGLRSAILQLATEESENRAKWEQLPELEGYNPLGRAKPGATVLAVHPLSEPDDPKIIIANQRFGRGRSMVLATSSTWHWQMGMPHEDQSHERFWRQTLRWLALNAPKPLECHLDKETFAPFEEVTLKVELRDSSFNYIENATIKATITAPSGKTFEVPFNWSSNGKVEYIGTLRPDEVGLYRIDIMAYSATGDFLGRTENAFFVEESLIEFRRAHLQPGLLKRIAEVTGGKYFHENEVRSLPDEIAVKQSSYSKLVEYDLWDMPLIFLLAVVLLSIEWYIRRSKGLS